MRARTDVVPEPGNEDALFLSLQNKRITVHSVENLVKKYAGLVTQLKKITPHKLRSTYGTPPFIPECVPVIFDIFI